MTTSVYEDAVEELREVPGWDWSAPLEQPQAPNPLAGAPSADHHTDVEPVEPAVLRVEGEQGRGIILITPTNDPGVAHVAADVNRGAGRKTVTHHFEANVRQSWIRRITKDCGPAEEGAAIVQALEELSAISGQRTVAASRGRQLPPADR